MLSRQRAVYPALSSCSASLSCPLFQPHRCVPLTADDGPRHSCWLRHMEPPLVEAADCDVNWREHGLTSKLLRAMNGSALYMIGDSMAEQQWRSLLCLLSDRINQRQMAGLAKQLQRRGFKLIGTELCADVAGITRVCTVRAAYLEQVEAEAARRGALPGTVLLLSAHAHEANRTEQSMVRDLVRWRRRQPAGSIRARIIWRTRGADHYGDSGFSGLRREPCHAASAAQRVRLASSALDAEGSALRENDIGLLDAGPASVGAHRAHPIVCARGSYYDCLHFCTPGPVEHWNRALANMLVRAPPETRTDGAPLKRPRLLPPTGARLAATE